MPVFVLSLLEFQNGSLQHDKIVVFRYEQSAIAELDKWFHHYCDRYDVKELGKYDTKSNTHFHIEDATDYMFEVTASITPHQIIE